ncbi:MAG: GGDEF domain-containing protein [Treponema sp.]|jgi:diguanylate cyclase (GGDEF)-like protein|nr:GGDEF domain-containing protein [Treponema sp.]
MESFAVENQLMDGQEKDLFVRIFRQLGTYRDPYQSISGILKETCDFFGFFCGFVYEADHGQVFRLCEHYLGYEVKLIEEFTLNAFLNEQELDELIQQTGVIMYLNTRQNTLGAKFLKLFSAKTLVMVPVIFENKNPVAFVGMMDRRHPIRFSKKEIDDTDAILSVLAGHIKTRVYQKRLELSRISVQNILDNSGIEIYVNDFSTGEILFVNKSMSDTYGGNLLGKRCWEAFFPAASGPCRHCVHDRLIDKNSNLTGTICEDWQRPLDGAWFRVLNTIFRWVDGRLVHLSSSINITENKKKEELIRRLAEHDPLTGLYNRRKFIDDFEEAISLMKNNGTAGYLLFMDLDDFKHINDTMGHLEGDALLGCIAGYLSENEELIGTPYRYGGDEFAIIARNKTTQDLFRARDALLERFTRNWQMREHAGVCGISIGAVLIPEGERHAAELIQAADLAMYAVKKGGKHGFKLA